MLEELQKHYELIQQLIQAYNELNKAIEKVIALEKELGIKRIEYVPYPYYNP